MYLCAHEISVGLYRISFFPGGSHGVISSFPAFSCLDCWSWQMIFSLSFSVSLSLSLSLSHTHTHTHTPVRVSILVLIFRQSLLRRAKKAIDFFPLEPTKCETDSAREGIAQEIPDAAQKLLKYRIFPTLSSSLTPDNGVVSWPEINK